MPLATTLPTGGSRNRRRRVTIAVPEPATTSATSAKTSSISKKYSKEDKQQLAIILIENKTKLSARKVERKLGFDGVCNGTKIGYHIKKMKGCKAAMDPPLWTALVDNACAIWLPRIHAEDVLATATLTLPSKSDLALPAAKRKRAAANAALNDMSLDSELTFDVAAAKAAKRFKLGGLSGQALRNLKKNPQLKSSGRPQAIYHQIEVDLAYMITFFRRWEVPIYRCDVKTLMNRMLKPIPLERRPFPNGVTDRWVVAFLKRHNLKCKNQNPNDLRRSFWMSSENMFDCFLKLAEVAVSIGVASENPSFKGWKETPEENPIFWIPSEMWRVIEFDESACEDGVKSNVRNKSEAHKVVCPEGDDGTTRRDSLPSHHISMMVTIDFSKNNLPYGIVYDKGDHALIDANLTTNDQGAPMTIPCMGEDGVEEKEGFYFSNEKGSFDTDILIQYLTKVLESMPRKFTATMKGLLFIDGCQTHVSERFISFCHEHHIEVVIKVPYASSKMQSMDCQGGHFVRFKSIFHKELQRRTTAKAIAFQRQMSQRGGKKRCAGSVGLEDFVHCAEPALRTVCTAEVHTTALRVVGLVPFSMRPAFEMLAKEEAKKQQQQDDNTIEIDATNASAALMSGLPAFMGVADEQQRTTNTVATGVRDAAVLAMEAKADSALAAGTPMTDEDIGNAAARLVIKNWSGLVQHDRNKLYSLGSTIKWATQHSGGVFANFGGHPTASQHRAYQQATLARKLAIENNKKRRKQHKETATAAKEAHEQALVGTRAQPGALYLRGIGVRWANIQLGGANYGVFTVPELIALAVVDGKIDKKDVRGKKKSLLCERMQQYFLLKQAELPPMARANAGVPAQRLE